MSTLNQIMGELRSFAVNQDNKLTPEVLIEMDENAIMYLYKKLPHYEFFQVMKDMVFYKTINRASYELSTYQFTEWGIDIKQKSDATFRMFQEVSDDRTSLNRSHSHKSFLVYKKHPYIICQGFWPTDTIYILSLKSHQQYTIFCEKKGLEDSKIFDKIYRYEGTECRKSSDQIIEILSQDKDIKESFIKKFLELNLNSFGESVKP